MKRLTLWSTLDEVDGIDLWIVSVALEVKKIYILTGAQTTYTNIFIVR